MQLANDFALDEQQCLQMEPLLYQAIETYYIDFKNCYRWNAHDSDGVMLRHQRVLTHGIPVEKLKQIFKPRQLEAFNAKAAEDKSIWEYIVSQREERLKKENMAAP
jgi:hypothetical protein